MDSSDADPGARTDYYKILGNPGVPTPPLSPHKDLVLARVTVLLLVERMTGSDTDSFPKDKAHLDDKIQVAFLRDVDTAAELVAGSNEPLDPTDALRVRWDVNDILGPLR